MSNLPRIIVTKTSSLCSARPTLVSTSPTVSLRSCSQNRALSSSLNRHPFSPARGKGAPSLVTSARTAAFTGTGRKMAKLDLTIPTLDLPDGNPIPVIGYGCGTAWFKKGDSPHNNELVEACKMAISMGYIHVDGAETYGTEEELGAAIKASGVDREKLFVTTKVYDTIEDIPAAIDKSLKKLGLTYVNLFLIHAPFTLNGDEDLQAKWAQMEEVAASGKAKSIGVSNYGRQHLEATLKTAKVRPAINQIEFHPYLQHGDLIPFMINKDIKVAAYGPLVPITKGKDGPLTPYLETLAKKYAVHPAEILLRWQIDRGIVAITTSSKEQRLSDYLRALTFKLTPKEIEDITNQGNEYHFRAFWNNRFAKDDRT